VGAPQYQILTLNQLLVMCAGATQGLHLITSFAGKYVSGDHVV
jgi:hypothetical protein